MPKFRKRPVIIDAEQWFPDKQVDGVMQPNPNSSTQFEPHVITLEGSLTVSPGDWIITGIKGEKYPCKPDVFYATYEPVESDALREWDIAYGFRKNESEQS